MRRRVCRILSVVTPALGMDRLAVLRVGRGLHQWCRYVVHDRRWEVLRRICVWMRGSVRVVVITVPMVGMMMVPQCCVGVVAQCAGQRLNPFRALAHPSVVAVHESSRVVDPGVCQKVGDQCRRELGEGCTGVCRQLRLVKCGTPR